MVAVVNEQGRQLWRSVAVAIAPRVRARPSDWSSENVRLSREMTPVRGGHLDLDWKPWTRDTHDLLHELPHKRGLIGKKPAQVGWSRTMLNLLACYCDTKPGPFLYMISDHNQAAHFQSEQFGPVIDRCERLRELFTRAGKKRRETLVQRPYIGGRVDFVGAGTVSSATSRTYVLVMIDEYELVKDNFPSAQAGSVWELALGRVQAVEAIACVIAWSHPRRAGEGIDDLYDRLSDQREWCFDCPHCAQAIAPRWTMVRIPTDGDDQLDPDRAYFQCPHCTQTITDAQRARAVWPPRLGGTGRYVCQLTPDEERRRDYIGTALHRLVDPQVKVAALAKRFCGCKTDRDLMGFYNIALGETFALTRGVVTADQIEQRVEQRQQRGLPGGLWGAWFLTCGVDVQAPKQDPMFYVWSSAWSPSGIEYVVDLARIKGWASLANYLRIFTMPLYENGNPVGFLSPRVCSIDSGYHTGGVLDFCRQRIESKAGKHPVALLPVRFRPHMTADAPALMPSEAKRIDPARPELGPIDHYDLHRDTWVDATTSRFQQDGRRLIWCPTPGDFVAQCTSNILEPKTDIHGWAEDETTWTRIKGRRDDWLMASCYNEAGAALKCGLYGLAAEVDRIKQSASTGGQGRGRPGDVYFEASKDWDWTR